MNIVSRVERFRTAPMLDRVDLKRLRYFNAVAEAGSFSRAAERLNMAQSHLSRQIMRLEAALGQRLFVRRARHVELTDAGQVLRQEAQVITSRLDRLPERMKEAAGGALGALSLAFTVLESFVPLTGSIISGMAREEPQLSLRLCVETRTHLIEAILDRRVHAGFARMPANPSAEVRVDELVREPIMLAVGRSHRLARREQIQLADLAKEPFVLCERNLAPEIYDDIIRACQNAGFSPNVIFHTPEPACALLLASAGVGVTMVPSSLRSCHNERLHFLSLAGDVLNTSLALITRADEHIASVKLLRKHALAIAAVEGAGRQLAGMRAGHR